MSPQPSVKILKLAVLKGVGWGEGVWRSEEKAPPSLREEVGAQKDEVRVIVPRVQECVGKGP